MDMNIQVEGAAKPLHDDHRPAAPVPHPGVARPAPQEAEDRAQGPPHHGAAQGVVPRQPVAQTRREAQHPLTHGHVRKHVAHPG